MLTLVASPSCTSRTVCVNEKLAVSDSASLSMTLPLLTSLSLNFIFSESSTFDF